MIGVEQTAGRPLGFVAAGAQFVLCNQPFAALPVGGFHQWRRYAHASADSNAVPPLALVKVFGNDSEDTAIPPRIK